MPKQLNSAKRIQKRDTGLKQNPECQPTSKAAKNGARYFKNTQAL
jgi:hypothetical protein